MRNKRHSSASVGRSGEPDAGRLVLQGRGGAISASLEADRQLRLDYEQSLTVAHALGAISLEANRSSVMAESTRGLRILLACSLGALAIGGAVATWLVRSIASPIAGLTVRLGVPS